MLPVSLTGFAGYFIFNPHLTRELLFVTAGILLLAISASILNQLQEIATDRIMERTHNRPLPTGKIKRSVALFLFFAALCAGCLLILATGSIAAFLISIFTILWYNGVYTYLKRVTAYAVVPGALTGALPPLIGWTAAGGSFPDKIILTVQLLFFLGQIPHFWLFILKYGEEYSSAGFPSLTSIMSRKTISILIFIWIVASAVAAGGLWFFGVIQNSAVAAGLLLASMVLVIVFMQLPAGRSTRKAVSRYSAILDVYFLLIIVLLMSDRIISL
ncbi:MAG TPA: UbiA family prenyltransferase [Bacteroidales bacterium]|nr:UbiA family prenyltransferase [Bacteroidales bacterium]